jgi:hypothetical protein
MSLSPSRVSGACLPLLELAYLMQPNLLPPFLPGVKTEERSCGAAKHATEGEGRGRGQPLTLVCGSGPVWLRWAVVARLLLVGPPKRLSNRCATRGIITPTRNLDSILNKI